MAGIPLDPFKQEALTREQAVLYLERIALPSGTIDERPSLDLLSRLLLAQLEQVPKDTTPLHVAEPQWTTPSVIRLSTAYTNMPESTSAFDRIVKQRKGAFCFAINATLSAFLRSFGFRVSELVGRTFGGDPVNDPLTHEDGFKWKTMTHEMMVVDWDGSDGRYLVDGAWGPWACPVPVKLESGETVKGLNNYEAFRLVEEYLPLSPHQTRPIDEIKGWTFYRRITPPNEPISLPITSEAPGHWTPFFHFHLASIPLLDFRLYHHFSASHELASFTAFWLVTKLIPNSGGARRSMMYAEKEGHGRKAKVYTTGGHDAKGCLEGRDVEWVEMETETMKQYLKKEFGFGF